MAELRRLKGEIDRTLKKVQEGQEVFEGLWVQVHDCDNSNQREKLEGELKKEIKKLQRLREQIKAWIAGADIKDKQPLMDTRKSIEKDMERFKVCEREMKMAGRAGVAKPTDPKEKAKDDAREWINNSVEALTAKVEESEYELEELGLGGGKKNKKPPPRVAELEEIVGRHKEHMGRLEKVLRCIDNETIHPDELEDLKSDMEMYLSGEGEEDGVDYSQVDVMYDELLDRLDALDQSALAANASAAGGKHGGKGPIQPKGLQQAPNSAVSSMLGASAAPGHKAGAAVSTPAGPASVGAAAGGGAKANGPFTMLRDALLRAATGADAEAASMEPVTLPPAQPVFSTQAAKLVMESCYAPRHPAAVPASYPRTPHEVVDNPALFRKVDPECLFFAFYFQPETYQQYMAAHELKRQSWRFHKHHNAWFQRFTEPSVTSEEYEQGAYVYFDYNIVHDDLQTGWCYRRKENFTFRYDALEDELRVS
ncbi:Not1 N-terminal domain, CCR4-Not complex component-domain-containing protein [Dunaliella salina]|uniref:Not1 N-terminal domain, CCR4-Not complex component-domain-containing protein n=1 Tax=Dunaliella salina TaxID=3046 RepID=A0ABQ7GNQ5_DUNSA|nr:Not1 N-terminal domain, CCR4-Not complex component-domain-containing protein [Dunaliella salina]|eukprot:KAF5836243.1 Not1 N-terminal domain, CCR4-Not complex component-domain-containing protein [Dunaliella salina]